MNQNHKPKPDEQMISQWLAHELSQPVENLSPLDGGYWSSAYQFTCGSEKLVLRLGEDGEGYAIDQQAMAFATEVLPIPKVMNTGQALGYHYAISAHHDGHFIETRPESKIDNVATAMSNLLLALKSTKLKVQLPVVWYEPKSTKSWHEWLIDGITDHAASHTAGWRNTLQKNPRINDLFSRCEAEILTLITHCEPRQELIHGDLLHQNVLVNDAADKVSGVFSWKCSALGDFLYDVAWCLVWQSWFTGFDGDAVLRQTLNSPDVSAADLAHANARLRCYQLQIAASHFAWYLWTEDTENLAKLADVTEHILLSPDTLARV